MRVSVTGATGYVGSAIVAELIGAGHHVVEAIGVALAGSDRPLVVTSGTAGLAPGRLATEEDVLDPGMATALRAPLEEAALAFAARGVRASVVRACHCARSPTSSAFV